MVAKIARLTERQKDELIERQVEQLVRADRDYMALKVEFKGVGEELERVTQELARAERRFDDCLNRSLKRSASFNELHEAVIKSGIAELRAEEAGAECAEALARLKELDGFLADLQARLGPLLAGGVE